MTVDLSPHLEAAIHEKVQSGKYSDANEVVREALDLLEIRDRQTTLREAIDVAEADFVAGKARVWTPDRLEELKREADKEDREGLPISADVIA